MAVIRHSIVESIEKDSYQEDYAWTLDNRNLVISHPRKSFLEISLLDVIKKTHEERGEVLDESRAEKHIREEHDYLNRLKAEKKCTVPDQRDISDMFGSKRLEEAFRRSGDAKHGEIMKGLLKELRDYQFDDDVTLVVLKRLQ